MNTKRLTNNRANISRLIDMMGMKGHFNIMIDQMLTSMMPTNDLRGADLREYTFKNLKSYFIDIFEKYYTEDEINDLMCFYSSPVGRKVVNFLPETSDAIFEIGSRLVKCIISK